VGVAGRVERGGGHLGGGRALVGGAGVEVNVPERARLQDRHLVIVEVHDLVGVADQAAGSEAT
jgi:hypothetical protein